jgi:hypothetical protein
MPGNYPEESIQQVTGRYNCYEEEEEDLGGGDV